MSINELNRGEHAGTLVEPMKSAPSPRFSTGLFALVSLGLLILFSRVLYDLVWFAAKSELYSHILIVPFISLYLWWSPKEDLDANNKTRRGLAGLFFGAGLMVSLGYWLFSRTAPILADQDYLAWMTFAFFLFAAGDCVYFAGNKIRRLTFPLAFLAFMIPFPTVVENVITSALQRGSAATADALFNVIGTPVIYKTLVFQLPGIVIEVAPECSGIHSSLVLFVTSILAGHFFLKSPWKRTALTLAVLPLAVLRNAVRIVTIGELCVHVRPEMIDSYIHRHGGPIFFALSLVPFSLLLFLFWKSDGYTRTKKSAPLTA